MAQVVNSENKRRLYKKKSFLVRPNMILKPVSDLSLAHQNLAWVGTGTVSVSHIRPDIGNSWIIRPDIGNSWD